MNQAAASAITLCELYVRCIIVVLSLSVPVASLPISLSPDLGYVPPFQLASQFHALIGARMPSLWHGHLEMHGQLFWKSKGF